MDLPASIAGQSAREMDRRKNPCASPPEAADGLLNVGSTVNNPPYFRGRLAKGVQHATALSSLGLSDGSPSR